MTDNIIEFPTSDEEVEYESSMTRLLAEHKVEDLGLIISGVLEFLTMRALHDGAFYIMTDDANAITVFAANEDAATLKDILPDTFKSWEEEPSKPEASMPTVLTNVDPGDEQNGETE